MNNVIQALTSLASDASLLTKQDINVMLENANITELQQQAILNANAEQLVKITNLSTITAVFPLIAADDDEEAEVTITEQRAANS